MASPALRHATHGIFEGIEFCRAEAAPLLLGLLRDVSGRQSGAFAEEEILHVLRHQLLRFLLPWHEAVFVEDHLHTLLPELPRLGGDVLVDPLAKFTGPRRGIEAGELLLELRAEDHA